MKKALMVGIDTGSSSTKVSLFDVEGQLLIRRRFLWKNYFRTLYSI